MMIRIDEKDFFMLYACCVPVKGAARSIICDIQRNTFFYITNDVYEIITQPFSLLEIDNENKRNDILEILNYLKEQDFGFFTSEPENFPCMDLSLDDFPEIVKNSLIDFDRNSDHDLQSIVNQLSELRCSSIELRFFDSITQDVFTKYLSCFEKSTVRTLNIVLRHAPWTTLMNMDKILFKNKRLSRIIIHNSKKKLFKKINLQSSIYFTKEDIKNASCCGNISPYYFQVNINFFKEAITSNTCLSKKLCIDTQGYIKNCPAMENSYGHIRDTKLKECLENEHFQKLWHIKKNEIEICKDCEFRYICPDCRAFTISDNLFSKPKKCSYDPYKNLWN